MLISVVIPTVDNIYYLKQLLNSIFENITLQLQIILIDDGSINENTFEYYKSINNKVEIIYNELNLGFVKSVNKGINYAKGEYILLLNNDIVIPPLAIENLLKAYQSDKNIGIISPLSNNHNPLPEKRLPPGYNINDKKIFFSWADKLQKNNENHVIYYHSLDGFCFLFSKSFYNDIKLDSNKLFDEIFIIGNFEDKDLCRRAVKKGYKLAIATDSYVHHYTHATFRKDIKRYYQLLKLNRKIYRDKWDKYQKITAMLAIKNEEKYIGKVLSHLSQYVDSIAILDDASTDNTLNIVKKFPKVKKIHINPQGIERHEGRDRNLLFKLAKEIETDWFLCLDGDEIFEDKIIVEIQNLCNPISDLIEGWSFPIYHFWRGETYYRVDKPWGKQGRFKLFRNKIEFQEFNKIRINASSVPLGINQNFLDFSPIRIKHYGYSDYEKAVNKYHFYEKTDDYKNPVLVGGNDYSFIIDESDLELLKWEEHRKKTNTLSIAVYFNNNNYDDLNLTLNSLNNSYDELIIINSNSNFDIQNFDLKIKNISILHNPEIKTFTEFKNYIIKNFSTDFILLIKSGEFFNNETHIRINDHIKKTDYCLSNIIIKYLDPIFPYPSFIECRLIKKNQEIHFFDNKLNPNIPKYTPVHKPIAEIISKNNLNTKLINQNINNCIFYNKKDPNNIDYLLYLVISLCLNNEFTLSEKTLKKYSKYLSKHYPKKKLISLMYSVINSFYSKNYNEMYLNLQNASKLGINSYYLNIWYSKYYFSQNDLNKSLEYLDIELPIKNDLSSSEKELFKIQRKYIFNFKKELIKLNKKYKLNFIKNPKKNLITAMLLIKNEERYIGNVLSHLSEYVDAIAILDDASTDNTLNIVKSFPKVKKLHINPQGIGRHEGRDRNFLFKLSKEIETDWFLCLDGDEIFEDRAKYEIPKLCENENIEGYLFRVFNFWKSKTKFRVDGIWREQLRFKLFRNRDIYKEFANKKLHVQPVPVNFPRDKIIIPNLRVKHYGYSNNKIVIKKFNHYDEIDNNKSIKEIGNIDYSHLVNDENIELIEWEEDLYLKTKLSILIETNNINTKLLFYLENIKYLCNKIYLLIPNNIEEKDILNKLKDKYIIIQSDNNITSKNLILNFKQNINKNKLNSIENIDTDYILFINENDLPESLYINKIKEYINYNFDLIVNFIFNSKNHYMIRTNKEILFDNENNLLKNNFSIRNVQLKPPT